MVENIVSIELSYINTKHPDFQKETALVGSMMASDYVRPSSTSRERPAKNRPVQFANPPGAITPVTNGDEKENMVNRVMIFTRSGL